MDITDLPAWVLSEKIHNRSFSVTEVMQSYLTRIDKLNPRYNAIVSRLDTSYLLEESRICDDELSKGNSRGWMHGFPIAVKDMSLTAGVTTTLGSPLMRNFVPTQDSLMVGRLKGSGAIIIGKTNTPEFGLGSHTFNEIFGATCNAFNPLLSAGGSSGGAAVGLALRMLPVADGSDFMGSLRNPAGWNNLFGMRPSQGRVPSYPVTDVWISQLSTEGPMARNVRDLASLLDIQSGPDSRCPLALDRPSTRFSKNLDVGLQGRRIGWLADLDEYLPLEDGILKACEAGLQRISSLGCKVESASLGSDPEQVWATWLTWRKVLTASKISPYMLKEENHPHIKPEALWEFKQAQGLSANEFASASVERSRFYQNTLKLFDTFDVLALPSAQVWPFPIDWRWPKYINTKNGSVEMDTYHRWMEVVIYASLAGLPSISVPTGFNSKGLPMGLQLIGKPQGDLELLQLAYGYEKVISDWLSVVPENS